MDKALVFGTKDCRLESCQGHVHMPRILYPLCTPRSHATFADNHELRTLRSCFCTGTNTLPGRLELPTLRLTASRSNQLSYGSDCTGCEGPKTCWVRLRLDADSQLAECLRDACTLLSGIYFGAVRFWNLHDPMHHRYAQATKPKPPFTKKGLRDRNSPTCTLSQNGYGTSDTLFPS